MYLIERGNQVNNILDQVKTRGKSLKNVPQQFLQQQYKNKLYGLFLLSQKSINKLKETHVNTSTTYSFSFGEKTQMDTYDVKQKVIISLYNHVYLKFDNAEDFSKRLIS